MFSQQSSLLGFAPEPRSQFQAPVSRSHTVMGQELPPGCTNPSRVSTNLENFRRRDPKSREFLRPLFGQVAVATVRNVLSNNVASLQNADKLLASKVAELRARREELQSTENERPSVNALQDEPGADCALRSEEQDASSVSSQ